MLLRSSVWATLIFLLVYFVTGSPTGAENNSLADSSSPGARQISSVPVGDALKGKIIVVDPGHGGYNAGAVGASSRTFEKTNVLFMAKDLKNLLEKAGAKVVMTRDQDISPKRGGLDQLDTRVAIANSAGADLFVSIHNDANTNRNIVGTTTYYYGSTEARRLAESVQSRLANRLGSTNLGIKSAPFVVLRKTRMPAVLVEVGFISNYWEERRLADPGYRYKASLGIFEGIQHYLSSPSFHSL